MARKLPWTTNGTTNSPRSDVRRTQSVVPKKEKHNSSHRPTTPEAPISRPGRINNSRSPSTSPIQPPSQPVPRIELMRPGLDGDDLYIMVEDEFESTARQFTAHLHAAEYARLKRKAREQPPKALPAISPSMPRTTQQNIERRHLLSRQSTALSNLGKRQRDADESDTEAEENTVDDPWRGTSLAKLMGEGSQVKTSLVGLQRIDSGTRAARGFGRGDSHGSPRREKKTITDIFEETSAVAPTKDGNSEAARARSHRGRLNGNAVHTSESADGVSARNVNQINEVKPDVGSRRNQDRSVDRERSGRKADAKEAKQIKTLPSSAATHNSVSASTSRRNRFHDFGDFDADLSEIKLSSYSRAKSTTAPPASRKTDVKKDRKSRLDEVPVFLA